MNLGIHPKQHSLHVQKQELDVGNDKPIIIDVNVAQVGDPVRTGDAFR